MLIGGDHPHCSWGKSPVPGARCPVPVPRWGSENLGIFLAANTLLFPKLVSGNHPHCSWGKCPVPGARPLVTALAY